MSEQGAEIPEKPRVEFKHPDANNYENPQLKARIERESTWGNFLADFVNKVNYDNDPNKTILELAQHITNIEDSSGKRADQLGTVRDEAYIDSKTGLRNEKGFWNDLGEAKNGTLVLLDLDRFKGINDKFGHSAGDAAITHYAKIIEAAVAKLNETTEEQGQAYHMHGDESAIILPVLDDKKIKDFLDKLIANVSEKQLIIDGNSIALAVSAGAAKIDPAEGSIANYKRVDELLYKAKDLGRGRSFVDNIDN